MVDCVAEGGRGTLTPLFAAYDSQDVTVRYLGSDILKLRGEINYHGLLYSFSKNYMYWEWLLVYSLTMVNVRVKKKGSLLKYYGPERGKFLEKTHGGLFKLYHHSYASFVSLQVQFRSQQICKLSRIFFFPEWHKLLLVSLEASKMGGAFRTCGVIKVSANGSTGGSVCQHIHSSIRQMYSCL